MDRESDMYTITVIEAAIIITKIIVIIIIITITIIMKISITTDSNMNVAHFVFQF